MALDLGESYYDPYQDTQKQSSAPGIKEAVLSTAKTMLFMGALNMVGRAAWGQLSKVGAAGIARYGSGTLGNIANSGATSIGAILKNTNSGRILSETFRSATKPWSNALQKRSEQVIAARLKGPLSGAVKSFTSAFSDKKTFTGLLAKNVYHNAIVGAPIAYAIDTGLGYGEEFYGLEKKKWYDVPGKVANFGKWLGNNAVMGVGFSFGTKALKAVGAGGALGIKEAFRGTGLGSALQRMSAANKRGMPTGFGHSTDKDAENTFQSAMFDWNSKFRETLAGRTMNRAMTLGATINDLVRGANNALSDTKETIKKNFKGSEPSEQKNKQKVSDPIRSAINHLHQMWEAKRNNLTDEFTETKHHGYSGVHLLNNLVSDLPVRNLTKGFSVKPLVSQFANFVKEDKRTTLLDEIFGLQPLFVKDTVKPSWITDVKAQLRERVGNEADQLVDHVLNMRAAPGHYKAHGSGIKGGGVDLSMFDPLSNLKKMSSAILLKTYRVPLLKIPINLGDMFGVSSWASDSPRIAFWDGKRSYKLGEDLVRRAQAGGAHSEMFKTIFPKGRSPVSTANVTEDVWKTVYLDGKLNFFTNDGIHSMDWGRKLVFDYEHGARRGNENAWIKNRSQKDKDNPHGTPSEKGQVHNKWLSFWVDGNKLSLPTFARRALDKVTALYSGKHTEYKQISEMLAGGVGGQAGRQWETHAPIIEALRLQVGQELHHTLTKPGALEIMANATHNSEFGGLIESMVSAPALHAKLRGTGPDGSKSYAKYLASKGTINEELELLQVYPSKGGGTAVRGHGLSKELSLEDRVRFEMFDDVLSRSIPTEIGADHPLMLAAPKLLEHGYINAKDMDTIKLYSTINSFNPTGIYNRKIDYNNAAFGNILHRVRTNLQKTGHDVRSEIIKYGQHRNLRRVKPKGTTLEDQWDHATDEKILLNKSPYVSVASDPLGFFAETAGGTLESVTNMMRDLIIPFEKDPVKHFGLKGNLKYLTGAMVKTAVGVFAFKALDASIAANPLLDDTSLESGVTGAIADVAAAARLGGGRVMDALGLTGVAKHLNGLLPGFTTSAPGAIIGAVVSRTMGGGAIGMAKGFAMGAIGNRILSPLLPDFTKSYDQLQKEYSGNVEVPMMKSPYWLLGPTPWGGQKVEGYTPNWYVRTKSRWKETDTLYGSTFRKLLHEPIFPLGVAIGDFIDPYFMERKHYFSRPYPTTGRIGEEIPLVGPLIAGTLGRILKPQKTMHQEFLSGGDDSGASETYPFADPPPTVQEGLGMMKHSWGVTSGRGKSSLFGTFNYSASQPWSYAMGEETLYSIQNFAGLKGFVAGSISDRIFNRPAVLPTLETAGRIASQSRFYGDANLGGLGIFSEPVRRIIQKPDSRRFGINPIPNMMPDWLPAEFQSGDPYAKIMRGELRLPGKAYQSTHASINQSMPARASMFGGPIDHIVQYYTGLLSPVLKEQYDIMNTGTTMHRQVQDQLAAEGLLIHAEQLVYDVKNDITGHIDAVIRDGTGGGGRKALEVKTINEAAFRKMSGPKYEHVGQLNFYLRQTGMRHGEILYVNRENPGEVKTYNIKYSKSRFEKDLAKLNKARQVAIDVMKDGIGDKFGYTYSWLDRLKILADVSPFSDEFKEAKLLVDQQIRSNLLTAKDITEYRNILKHKQSRMRKYELYPNRFKGKVLSPSTELNIQSINEDIKAGADYSLPERVIGSAWETFTNSNNFISNKLFAFKDPLEHYKRLKLYGKEYTPWDDPWGSFGDPALKSFLAKDNPIGGAYKGGMLGFILGGGPIGALIGTVAGGAYGTANGLFRTANDSIYIPGVVKEQRKINEFFDVAKFERYSRMSQLSEGLTKQEYQDAANATLNAYNQTGSNIGNLFRATPYLEKPYIAAWLGENDPKQRKEILRYLPKDLSDGLKRAWQSEDQKENTGRFVKNSSAEVAAGYNGPGFKRSILDPSVKLEDIKLKTVNEAGLNAHDFGLGWNDQLVRIQDDYNQIGYVKQNDVNSGFERNSPNLNSAQVRYAIIEALRNKGVNGRANVYINAGEDDINSVTITVNRDRSGTAARAISNRSKYLG